MAEDTRAFKKQLEYLDKFKGRHTEMISVYVPASYELAKVIQQLELEHGTASNIKSKNTKLNVMDSLTRIIQFLKQFKQTPEKGLVVFAGNTSEKEGERDIEVFTLDPPNPVSVKVYKCAQKFFLDPLWEMTESKEKYGLIIIERGSATIGLLKGKKIEVVEEKDSLVFGKFRDGGQSAHRFEQIRKNLLNDFFKSIGELSSKVFLEAGVTGVIVGGPGPTKEEFMEGEFLDYRIKEKVLGVRDIGNSGYPGLLELVERSNDILKEAEVVKEKKIVQRFLEGLGKGTGVAYGEEEVRDVIARGAADVVLLSEGLEWKRVKVTCSCRYGYEGTVRDIEKFKQGLPTQKCPKCGAQSLSIIDEKELVEELKEFAESNNVQVELISTDTTEGQQLLALGGIAAILRFQT